MLKKLNNSEKKLKFHCSACFTTWQLLEIQRSFKNKETRCLNRCQEKWENLLITYCQEQIILDIARQEQQKDASAPQEQDLTRWLEQIKKNNKK
jgi:hypothetical protein